MTSSTPLAADEIKTGEYYSVVGCHAEVNCLGSIISINEYWVHLLPCQWLLEDKLFTIALLCNSIEVANVLNLAEQLITATMYEELVYVCVLSQVHLLCQNY